MKPFFEEQLKSSVPVEYPDYFLAKNPFPSKIDLTEGVGEGQDFFSLFCKQIYDKEINQVLFSVLKASERGKKKFWLLKNEQISSDHNVSVVAGLFRALTISVSPRVYPTYVPFPVIVPDPLGGILRWCMDRLSVDRFRLCVYAFAYSELKKLQESGMAVETLPDIDVADLLQKMNETKGEALDEVLFVKEPEEPEKEALDETQQAQEGQVEGGESEAPERSEKEAAKLEQEQEASRQEAEAIAKELEQKKQKRDELVVFITDKIAVSKLAPQFKAAVAVAITEGFEKGRSYISMGEYRETLKGLLTFVSLFYENAAVILDRLDNWDMLQETQRAAILGTLTELAWLFGESGILIISTYNRTVGAIGEEFVGSFEKLPLDLWPVTLDLKSTLPQEKAIDLVSYFLQSDQHRREVEKQLAGKGSGDIHPFTEDGVTQIAQQVERDIGKFLIAAGELIDAGKTEQYGSIDADFVKKHLSKA